MVLIFLIVSALISYIILSYFLWKELKVDYLNTQIFTFSFWFVVTCYLGAYLTYLFLFPNFWFYGGLIFSLSSFLLLTKKYGIKRYEILDCLVKGILSFSLVVILLDFVIFQRDLRNLFLVSVIFILILIHNYIKSNYKKFSWYKSGRIGIAGSITISVFFLTRLVISLNSLGMLSFSGKTMPEAVLSLGVLTISLYNVYRLTQK